MTTATTIATTTANAAPPPATAAEFADQYYQDTGGKLHWLSAQDQANLTNQGRACPPAGWIAITADQAKAALAPSAAQVRAAFLASAQAALSRSDTVVVRCYSAAVAVPAAWQTYRQALRAIVNGSDTASTVLPAIPAYPAGT